MDISIYYNSEELIIYIEKEINMENGMFNIATNVREMVNVVVAVEKTMDSELWLRGGVNHREIADKIRGILGEARTKAETVIPYIIRDSMMMLYNGIEDHWDAEGETSPDGIFSKGSVEDNIGKLLSDSFSHIASEMDVTESEILLELYTHALDSLNGVVEKLDSIKNNRQKDINMSKKKER